MRNKKKSLVIYGDGRNTVPEVMIIVLFAASRRAAPIWFRGYANRLLVASKLSE